MGMSAESGHEQAGTRLDSGSLAALAETFVRASNAHDGKALAELYREDASHREAATGAERSGREAIAAGFMKFVAVLADAHWEPLEIVVSGVDVMVIYRLTGRLAAPLGPFPGNGQAIDLYGAQKLSIADDGKVRRSLDYWNPRTFAAQARRGDT